VLLHYTGVKRAGRSILQSVLHRYLARERTLLRTLERMTDCTLKIRHAIETRDLDAFGEGLRGYWELKKEIDPGVSTPEIERALSRIRGLCSGYTLLGMGG